MKRQRRRLGNRWVVNVLATALLLAAVGAGLLVVRGHVDDTAGINVTGAPTEAAAMLAARTEVIAFFTLDPAHVESQIDDVLRHAGGAFRKDYSARRAEAARSIVAAKRTVSASVDAGGTAISDFTDRSALVLVALSETSQQPGRAPVVEELRMRLAMARGSSGWKTVALDQLAPVVGGGQAAAGSLPGGNSAVLAAATTGVRRLLSYDYRTMTNGLDATMPLMTPGFGAQFANTFTTTVQPAATSKKSVATAYIRGVGLVVRDGSQARCLVFVDQVLRSSGAPSVAGSSLFVALKRIKGRWLVDGLSRA